MTSPGISTGDRGGYASILNYAPVTITVGGTSYNISYETGLSSDLSSSSLLASQPWWNNPSLAASYRDAYISAIGANGSNYYKQFWPNDSPDGDSAFFMYDDPGGTAEMFYGNGNTYVVGPNGYFTYAKVVPAGAFSEPVVIDGNITLSAGGSHNLTSAQITIGSNYNQAEDVLSFANIANITGSWDQNTGFLHYPATKLFRLTKKRLKL